MALAVKCLFTFQSISNINIISTSIHSGSQAHAPVKIEHKVVEWGYPPLGTDTYMIHRLTEPKYLRRSYPAGSHTEYRMSFYHNADLLSNHFC